jgi:hypothetical protein
MKVGDAKYKVALESWLHEEFMKSETKPQGMYGNWAWRVLKEREFQQMMRDQRRLE